MIEVRGMTPLIQVFDLPTSLAFYRDILGFAVKPRVAPYGMKQLYLSDPDGYNLCFQWPT